MTRYRILAGVLMLLVSVPLMGCDPILRLLVPTELPRELQPDPNLHPTSETEILAVVCDAFDPITWSSRDTAETRNQVIVHNEVWEELCHAFLESNSVVD